MAETESIHPTAGRTRRRCKQKGPPATVQAPLPRLELASDTENEHSDGLAGEKKGEEAEIRTYYSSIYLQQTTLRIRRAHGDHESGNQGS